MINIAISLFASNLAGFDLLIAIGEIIVVISIAKVLQSRFYGFDFFIGKFFLT